MNTLKHIALALFCISSAACSSVVNSMLEDLDGGADASTACFGLDDGADCDDEDFCNGPDTCVSGVCVRTGNPADDGALCEVGTTQICVEGDCRVSMCGDGVVSLENEEECDTADATIGCDINCQFLCEQDDECDTEESSCDDNLECKPDFRCGVDVSAPNTEDMACMTMMNQAGTCQSFECCPEGAC